MELLKKSFLERTERSVDCSALGIYVASLVTALRELNSAETNQVSPNAIDECQKLMEQAKIKIESLESSFFEQECSTNTSNIKPTHINHK